MLDTHVYIILYFIDVLLKGILDWFEFLFFILEKKKE